MIINNSNDKIKIIVDEIDLKNSNISLKEWISNPRKTCNFLKKLLLKYEVSNTKNTIEKNSNTNYDFVNDLNNYEFNNFKEFNIYTYDFKIYYIEIKL